MLHLLAWLASTALAQAPDLDVPASRKAWRTFREDLWAYDDERAYALWVDTMAGSRAADPKLGASDSDGDGINDWWDRCPYMAEDHASGRERDGCPESAPWAAMQGKPDRRAYGSVLVSAGNRPADVDGDGLADADDRCPTEPEDFDGYQDADGCPDLDNDGDGIEDIVDLCPDEPEDFDGFQDGDGCPDPDNDRDGIADAQDHCPNEAETVNGFQDEDGCPDMRVSDLLRLDGPKPAPAPAPAPQAPTRPAPVAAALPVARGPLPPVDSRLVSGQTAPADVAVVIGLEDYAFISPVPFAKRDAEAFHNFLLYTRGVPSHRIQRISAGSVEHIRKAVARAGQEVGQGGTVWVYFAGHGAASATTRERVLLGDDVRADPTSFDARAIEVADLEALAKAGGGKVMMVLDTCFAGVGRSGADLIAGKRFAVPSYATASAGVAQWSAAGPNELSGPLEEARHGAFTYFVVGALRGWADGELTGVRDGVVTSEEAHAYVSRALKAWQQRDQRPVWTGEGATGWVLSRGSEVGPSF